jgi:spore maturation protein CgeB
MKILYAAMMTAGSASGFRRLALERLGHRLVVVNTAQYMVKNALLHKILFRVAAGPHATRLNRDLLRIAETERPDVFWADKQLLVTPRTLKKLSAMGITTVSYMIDNPFGPRKDPGWRTYLKGLPLYDLHVQQRDVSLETYRQHGAKDVVKVLIGFEPTEHFPSPTPLTDQDRNREISFVGTSYDDRAETLSKLCDAGLPVTVSGNERKWKRSLAPRVFKKVFLQGELYGDAYREAIWRSKINLSFLTRSNQDEYTQKTFEIAGCGEFMIVERSEGHTSRFKEDEEAVFFSTPDELIEKIRRYLPDEQARRRIAHAGRERALRDGYDNDSQSKLILERLEHIMAVKRAGA